MAKNSATRLIEEKEHFHKIAKLWVWIVWFSTMVRYCSGFWITKLCLAGHPRDLIDLPPIHAVSIKAVRRGPCRARTPTPLRSTKVLNLHQATLRC